MDLDESDDAFSACPLYQVDGLGSVKRGAIGSVKKSNNKEHLGFHKNFSGVLLEMVVQKCHYSSLKTGQVCVFAGLPWCMLFRGRLLMMVQLCIRLVLFMPWKILDIWRFGDSETESFSASIHFKCLGSVGKPEYSGVFRGVWNIFSLQ